MKLTDGQEVVCIEGTRSGYAPTQIDSYLTVGELIELLSEFDEDAPVILRNDKGYTYGEINYQTVKTFDYDEDEDTLVGEFDDEW